MFGIVILGPQTCYLAGLVAVFCILEDHGRIQGQLTAHDRTLSGMRLIFGSICVDFGFPVYRLDETTGNSIGSSVTDSPVVYSSLSLPEGLQAPAASSDFHVVPTYALPSEIEQSQIIPSEEVSTQPIPSDTSGKFIYPYKMPDTTIHYIFDSDVDYSNGIFGGKFMFSSQLPCPLILV